MVAVSINVTGQIYATYKKSDFCFNMKRNSKVVGGVTLLVNFTLRFVVSFKKYAQPLCQQLDTNNHGTNMGLRVYTKATFDCKKYCNLICTIKI